MANTSTTPPQPELRGFQLAQKVGAGSFGVVYKAIRKHNKNSFAFEVGAVKCLSRKKLNESSSNRIVEEITLLKTLNHPHILHMIDFSWNSSHIYILTEFCKFGDLSKFIKTHKTLTESTCKTFIRQLASALHYLHAKNTAHLDLKPSNILLTKPDIAELYTSSSVILKLADFGLATTLQQDGYRTDNICGSPLYMAPEILVGKRGQEGNYTSNVDLWSVGIILYECIFGYAPYKSNSLDEILMKFERRQPIVFPVPERQSSCDISDICQDLMSRCLIWDPRRRITFDDFFNHPFINLKQYVLNFQRRLFKWIDDDEKVSQNHLNIDDLKKALSYLYSIQTQVQASPVMLSPSMNVIDIEYRVACLQEQIEKRGRQEIKKKENVVPNVSETESAEPAFDELIDMCKSTPQLLSGLDIGRSGDFYLSQGSFSVALQKFESSLSLLLPALQAEPKGNRRRFVHSQLLKWMEKAENLKEILIEESIVREQASGNEVSSHESQPQQVKSNSASQQKSSNCKLQ